MSTPDLGDPERTRRARVLLRAVALTAGVGAVGSVLVAWASADPAVVVASMLSLFAVSALTVGLVRSRRPSLAAHVFVAALWLAGLGTTVQYGGVGGVGTVAMVTSVLAAGLLLPVRSLLGIAVASAVALGALVVADVRLTRTAPPGPLELYLVAITGIGFAVLFLFLAVRSIDEALAEARHARRDVEAVIDASPDAIVSVDADGMVLSANRAAETVLGVPGASLVGHRLLDAVVVEHGDIDTLRGLAPGDGTALFEWVLTRPDGTSVRVENHARIRATGLGVVQLVIRDITARAAAEHEREVLEGKLREGRRLESLGQLAGGIAHDFNNVLTAILGYAAMTTERDDVPEEVHEHMDVIRLASERAAALTRQLLAFARRQVLEPRVFDIDETVRASQSLHRRLLPDNLVLNYALGDAGHVNADPAQLEQVIMNLVINARDAMPDGGTITVETASVTLEPSEAPPHPDLVPGRYVRLAVTDTGFGMDEETRARVFEPFFTTKLHGGTGLGLATVHGIVRQSGGHIFVSSVPAEGTMFEAWFPAAVSTPEPAPEPRTPRPPGGNEVILLVDDDHLVRSTTAGLLRHLGFDVRVAADGERALAVLEEDPAVRLVLTDVVMPGLSGPELARRAVAVRPDLQIVYMSGYAQQVAARRGALDPGSHFIGKPFTLEQLATRLREVLDAHAPRGSSR